MKRKISLALVMMFLGGCSLSSHPAGGTTVVSVPLPQNENALSAFNTPTNIQSFDCYAVNVTGPGIAPIQGCPNGMPGQYVGILAGPVPVSAGSISVEVPNGNNRTFQLIGFDTPDGSCHPFGSGQNGAGYLLSSQAAVDVSTSQVISLHASFTTGQPLIELTGSCAIGAGLAACVPNSVQNTWCSGGSWGNGSASSLDGGFSSPVSIAVDPSSNIYVFDGTSRVQKFDSTGGVVGSIGKSSSGGTCTSGTQSGWCKGGSFSSGSGMGSFGPSGALAVNTSTTPNSLYVTDSSNSEVQIFNLAGQYLNQFNNSSNTPFSSPAGIGIDSSANLYIVDTLNHRVVQSSLGGSYVTAWGTSGAGDDEFGMATGIAVAGSYLYVTDTSNHRVDKFSLTGNYIGSIGYAQSSSGGTSACVAGSTQTTWCLGGGFHAEPVDGAFNTPSAVAVDSSGNLYVADSENNRIEKFSSSGAYLSSIGAVGHGDGEFEGPTGIAIDSSGFIYVVDSGNNRIERFTSAGQFYGSIGKSN